MSGEDERGFRWPSDRAEAERTARQLAATEGLRAVRRLQAAGDLPPSPRWRDGRAPAPGRRDAGAGRERAGAGGGRSAAAVDPAPDLPDGPRPISIWRPRATDDGPVWERPAPSPLGDHHADRLVLRPRRGLLPRRLVLLGESVAAGYLYAPRVTPAKVVQAQLDAAVGPGAWEVIDLARTNERLATLAATAEAAVQLAPDAVVVLAGNNWTLLETPELSPLAPSVTGRLRLAAALHDEGPIGAARLARREMAERAAAAFDRIAAATAASGAAVVLVLPEIDLTDWETRQPVHRLPAGGVARWHRLLRRALGFLGRGAAGATSAEAAAWEMVELDGGTVPTPFRLLARAAALDGRAAEARDAAISETDAVHYPLLAFLAAPRASSAARRILELAAARHGFATVDLRRAFARHVGSVLPGRRLFLDYCHLTHEGMAVAMAGVAARAVAAVDPSGPDLGGEARQRRLAAEAPPPSPAAEAVARFGAAVHTAHRHLPVTDRDDLVLAGCREALAASPGVAAAMLDLADARTAPGPEVLTAAQRRNRASDHRLLLQHGWRWDGPDGALLQAIRTALAETGPAEAAEVDRLLVARRAVGPSGTDLAAPPTALAEPLARFFPEATAPPALAPRATLRCPWPETVFSLVADGAGDVEVELTARRGDGTGGPAPAGRVDVALDGEAVGRLPLGDRWGTRRLRLPLAGRPGPHRLRLAWPEPPAAGPEPLGEALGRLELGVEAELHPVFGEVFSLVARRV